VIGPLTLLRPLRYDRVQDVLIIQTETGAQLGEIVARVRAIFPRCRIHLLVREADSELARSIDVEQLEVARWEERFDLLSRLRRRRYDVTVLQLGTGGPSELRLLPFLMRTRSLVAFNASLDYFPLNVFRLTTLAHHFSLVQGESGPLRALLSIVRGATVAAVSAVASVVVLLASVGWLELRGWWRRRRRMSHAGIAAARIG
jgi:hypothetical protein